MSVNENLLSYDRYWVYPINGIFKRPGTCYLSSVNFLPHDSWAILKQKDVSPSSYWVFGSHLTISLSHTHTPSKGDKAQCRMLEHCRNLRYLFITQKKPKPKPESKAPELLAGVQEMQETLGHFPSLPDQSMFSVLLLVTPQMLLKYELLYFPTFSISIWSWLQHSSEYNSIINQSEGSCFISSDCFYGLGRYFYL